jgi:hypothetical protein
MVAFRVWIIVLTSRMYSWVSSFGMQHVRAALLRHESARFLDGAVDWLRGY